MDPQIRIHPKMSWNTEKSYIFPPPPLLLLLLYVDTDPTIEKDPNPDYEPDDISQLPGIQSKNLNFL
jgi:hypothetical protein